MDASAPLPHLYPVLIPSISTPPFQCQGDGLLFNGYKRESIENLRAWILPKRKSSNPLKRPKVWWQAQLHLYGLQPAKSSTTIVVMQDRVKEAMLAGMQAPPQDLLLLEQQLNRDFLLKNAQERNKRYLAQSQDEKVKSDPQRFLQESFSETERLEDVLVLKVEHRAPIHKAAETLGLVHVSAYAPGRGDARWLVVGRDSSAVSSKTKQINLLRKDWVDGNTASKKRKVEEERKKQEVLGAATGTLEGVEGYWVIQSEEIEKNWTNTENMSMSIYFHVLDDHRSEDGCGSETCSEKEDYTPQKSTYMGSNCKRKSAESSLMPRHLCANFHLGVLEGILRSTSAPLASTSLPSEGIAFTWRGRETGEGDIQLDYSGSSNRGTLTFLSSTRLKGILKSSLGKFKLEGSKVGQVPTHKDYLLWESLNEDAYEVERVSRWH